MKEFKVMASNFHATYTAGRFCAENANQAVEMARQDYAKSSLGRTMRDVNGFRFYVVDKFPHEDQDAG